MAGDSKAGSVVQQDRVRHLWDRRLLEGPKAFRAFIVYRDLGPGRSQAEVAGTLLLSLTIVGRWSRAHHWVTRALAWDEHMDRARQRAAMKQATDPDILAGS